MSAKGRVKLVPLHPLPIITVPFSRVAIDFVGSLSPPSSEGHRYILTLIDYVIDCPRGPKLYHANLLKRYFRRSQVNFAEVLDEVSSEDCTWEDGRTTCIDELKDDYAPPEIPSDRTGFSAFELLYGRTVRGPLSVLRDLWEDRTLKDDDSRKLLPRETRNSTIERECLAIIFGILRFDYYLRRKEFILEVDHKPLTYLQTSRGKNDRLLRWALNLQAYKFRVIHVAGTDNIGADLLSRS
ncbi:hypothetical protein Pcinc_017360 [Petrolisthes cinctipes]|uniref:Reverse transcriptase RNase H-like domain-containing protein n=1 Tax=Petrolisthes cinctipes TaxID=88211 RepID=A0AAE1KNK1_PETCI|nr:hypothetical protein Pcinc_017360 [Petrolisthes cinctipes]